MAKDIKYDGSDAEMIELGLITENGVVVESERYRYSMYIKEVEARKKYRNRTDLINAGIVDENGAVIDAEKLREYELRELGASKEYTSGPVVGLGDVFRRAIAKIGLGRKKSMPINKNNTR
ncbi:MAG: hypothetical protein IJ560_01490 [Alphaproteobacteria bacterium]|nr:hypothetical protein [Alphaproteobacteria bacterium]